MAELAEVKRELAHITNELVLERIKSTKLQLELVKTQHLMSENKEKLIAWMFVDENDDMKAYFKDDETFVLVLKGLLDDAPAAAQDKLYLWLQAIWAADDIAAKVAERLKNSKN